MLEMVTTLKHRDDDAKIEVLDAAFWAKGCSSLGLLRYAVLLSVGGDDYCIIDIKSRTCCRSSLSARKYATR